MPEDSTLDAFASSGESDEDTATERDEDAEPVESESGSASDDDSAATDGGPTGPDDPTADRDATGDVIEESPGNAAGSRANTDVEPARSTFEWSPEGGACADCGESAERRWRRDGQRDGDLVCADCKEW